MGGRRLEAMIAYLVTDELYNWFIILFAPLLRAEAFFLARFASSARHFLGLQVRTHHGLGSNRRTDLDPLEEAGSPLFGKATLVDHGQIAPSSHLVHGGGHHPRAHLRGTTLTLRREVSDVFLVPIATAARERNRCTGHHRELHRSEARLTQCVVVAAATV